MSDELKKEELRKFSIFLYGFATGVVVVFSIYLLLFK